MYRQKNTVHNTPLLDGEDESKLCVPPPLSHMSVFRHDWRPVFFPSCIHVVAIRWCMATFRSPSFLSLFLVLKFPQGGNGPRLEVVQDQGNPWRGRSKLLSALRLAKIHLIVSSSMSYVSAIKLIRTDTTLDLSQKAEKRYLKCGKTRYFIHFLASESLWVSVCLKIALIFCSETRKNCMQLQH